MHRNVPYSLLDNDIKKIEPVYTISPEPVRVRPVVVGREKSDNSIDTNSIPIVHSPSSRDMPSPSSNRPMLSKRLFNEVFPLKPQPTLSPSIMYPHIFKQPVSIHNNNKVGRETHIDVRRVYNNNKQDDEGLMAGGKIEGHNSIRNNYNNDNVTISNDSPYISPCTDVDVSGTGERKEGNMYDDSDSSMKTEKKQTGEIVLPIDIHCDDVPPTRRPWEIPVSNYGSNNSDHMYDSGMCNVRSHSLIIKDLGGDTHEDWSAKEGTTSEFRAIFGSPSVDLLVKRKGLSNSSESSKHNTSSSGKHDAVRRDDNGSVEILVDQLIEDNIDGEEKQIYLSEQDQALLKPQLDPDALFSTSEEKTEIITSFILENLIIESISEDHCLPKFITVLGPYNRQMEMDGIYKYTSALLELIYSQYDEEKDIERRINLPIGHTDIQKLMLASPLIPESEQESIGSFEYEPVLDIRLYISLEERFREKDYIERNLDSFEVEREHILHKMIFDSLNENLDYKRKGGISGLPPRFSNRFRDLRNFSSVECRSIVEDAREEVMTWANMKNGAIMEKEPQLSYFNDIDGLDVMREKSMIDLLQEYVSIV